MVRILSTECYHIWHKAILYAVTVKCRPLTIVFTMPMRMWQPQSHCFLTLKTIVRSLHFMLLCPILCVLLLFWIEFKMLVYEMVKQEYVEKTSWCKLEWRFSWSNKNSTHIKFFPGFKSEATLMGGNVTGQN